jgi:NADH-quinone oxidoreductase subunit D
MSLSIGPAHPATHGVFRIVLELDGERVIARRPVIGYMHRGFEKLAEHRDYRQIMALVNRHDWLSGFSNELGVALAVEQMLEMEVPDRAQWIRMLIAEWNRILNHLMFIGSFAIELGAITPMFYAFREREDIQHLLESATGGRLHFTYNQVGGVKIDLPKGFLKQSAELSRWCASACRTTSTWSSATRSSRPAPRASGRCRPTSRCPSGSPARPCRPPACPRTPGHRAVPQVRRDRRAGAGRRERRLLRPLLRACCTASRRRSTSSTRSTTTCPPARSTPSCRRWSRRPRARPTCAPRTRSGQLGYWLESDGGRTPWRLKMRTPSFSNVQAIPYLLEGVLLPDAISVLGSVFFVVGDIDR